MNKPPFPILTRPSAAVRILCFNLAVTLVLGLLPLSRSVHAQAPPLKYVVAYDTELRGTWQAFAYSPPSQPVPNSYNLAATAPGRTGTAIEVRLEGTSVNPGFSLNDQLPFSNIQFKYLNEFRTLEFDVYLEPDSTGQETLEVMVNSANAVSAPRLVDLITLWPFLDPTEQFGTWHHITLDLTAIQARNPVLSGVSFVNLDGHTHFRLANVKLGYVDDTLPPVITVGATRFNATNQQLTLQFSTDELTTCAVEYGMANWASVVWSPRDWSGDPTYSTLRMAYTNHTVILSNLIAGATYQYKIVARDHRTDPALEPNQAIYTNFFTIPGTPYSPPVPPPLKYVVAYDSTFQGAWHLNLFSPLAQSATNSYSAAATAPGRTGNAIEVRFLQAAVSSALSISDTLPGNVVQFKHLNEFRTLEFDVYFEPSSTGVDELRFGLGSEIRTDEVHLTDLIPEWASMSRAQRYGNWHHILVPLNELHPDSLAFAGFDLANYSGTTHLRIADVKCGWLDRTNPPVLSAVATTVSRTYDQLTLQFSTDEPTTAVLGYGIGNFNTIIYFPRDWSTFGFGLTAQPYINHVATLTNLIPGATYQYQILVRDHRTDTNALPNRTLVTNRFTMPAVPTVPPLISGLAASGVTGSRAALSLTTDRVCTVQMTYHRDGGANLTRTAADFTTNRTFVLDLLEPATAYSVTVTVTDSFGLSATQALTFTSGTASTPTVTITADPSRTRPISRWIYGINDTTGGPEENFIHLYDRNPAPRNLSLLRYGGNRWTAYNWENNASNAGSDYLYQSDDYLDYHSSGDEPAEAVRKRVADDRARGMASMITVQLQGYAAADKSGPVNIFDPNHLATRFKQVVYRKGAPYTAMPVATDDFVYMDEFLWALRGKFTNDIFADPITPTFVSLDNEPEGWFLTHGEIQRTIPTTADYIERTISLSKALKDAVPTVQLFGPVHYGFNGLINFQNDATTAYSTNYWFVDKYLAEMRVASEAYGRRLIDVYDFHWYSEAEYVPGEGLRTIGTLVGTNLTDTQIQAIVQSPRSLWDATYQEDSWISRYLAGQNLGAPVNILGRLQAKIDAGWPGTKLAITEYNNGGGAHIAGAIAQADNLGVFGSRGIFATTFWPLDANLTKNYPFTLAAFKMYRDYDGQLGSFGDISIPTVSSDTAKVATYVSQDSSRSNRYVLVAINRSATAQDVNFSGLAVSGVARVYRIEGTQTTPVFVGEVPVNLATWVVTLPPLSVSTIEILRQESYTDWQASVFSAAEQQNPAVSGSRVDPDGGNVPNLVRFAFSLPARGPVNSPILPQMLPSGGASYLGLQFNRRAVAPGLTYVIEGGSTLTNWTVLQTISAGDPTRITIQDTAAMGANHARFLRIGVRYIP